jgi:endo-1,3-1,4-beta-glycanase ExoK
LPTLDTTLAALRTLFVLTSGIAFAAALLAMSAHAAEAEGASFRDDFDTFNSNRWIKSDHQQGLSYLDSSNVVVDNSYLRLRIPAGTTDGAEIESVDYYGYGTYRVRMKTADAPSSITGFFLYRSPDLYCSPDLYSEIDIEVYNDGTGNTDFVTYADGQRTHYVSKDFRFDPSADFHTYRFDYNPDSIQFYVDGTLRQTWTDGIPSASMKLLVNTWFPNWVPDPGQAPDTGRATRIDWIDYDQR